MKRFASSSGVSTLARTLSLGLLDDFWLITLLDLGGYFGASEAVSPLFFPEKEATVTPRTKAIAQSQRSCFFLNTTSCI